MSKHSNRMPVTTTTSRERAEAKAAAVAGTTPATEEKAPKARKTPRDKFTHALGTVQKTMTRLLDKMQINDTNRNLFGALETVQTATQIAQDSVTALPDDWTPRARKSPGVPSFIVGSVVSVRDKRREQASEILDEGELVGLTVVKIAGKIVRLVTPSGATVAAPKAWFRSDKKA
jgi:hypothetical protein